MKTYAVIGLGFGDEGKGHVVDWLCSQPEIDNPLVVRFSGGQQAGHNVITESGLQHIFASFGSGTLRGAPTYISSYCTIDPSAILNELKVLKDKKIKPTLYINKRCPVTTPWDIQSNLNNTAILNNGTCGRGVGNTWQREEKGFSLLFEDLFHPSVLEMKLKLIISEFYPCHKHHEGFLTFLHQCEELIDVVKVTDGLHQIRYNSLIFEGSQGLLLDQKYGFFPHVTRSNTGTKNILKMGLHPEVFLVTRAYQTRHGNGPMTNEDLKHKIKVNPFETNYDDGIQGVFRRSLLDIDLLKYAIAKDKWLSESKHLHNLVITCLDLVEDEYIFTIGNGIQKTNNKSFFINQIKEYLNLSKCYTSESPISELITEFK